MATWDWNGLSDKLAADELIRTLNVRMPRLSRALSITSPIIDVTDYGARGTGVADDWSSIMAAEADRAAAHGVLYFPRPTAYYAVSDYIDATAGLRWVGGGMGTDSFTMGTRIVATGTNKGILRWRQGAIGSIDPLGRGLYLSNLEFIGGANTGHLVNLARSSMLRADRCAFGFTDGTGFKDDQTTVIAAAGIYAYGCEHFALRECFLEGSTNLASGGAAGINAEKAVHMVSIENCQFNGNTYHIRFGDGGDNGVWHIHGGTNFQQGAGVLKSDSGTHYDIAFDTCWAENQTDTAGTFLQMSGLGGDNFNIVVENCHLYTPTVNTLTAFQGNYSSSRWINNSLTGQWNTAFSVGSASGGNVESGTSASNTATLFAGNSPAGAGFIRTSVSDTGGISADHGDASATVAWGVDTPVQLWNSPLSVDRTCTVQYSATGVNGQSMRVVRGAGATGAVNLNINDQNGAVLVKALATAGTWADVMFNGTALVEIASGAL